MAGGNSRRHERGRRYRGQLVRVSECDVRRKRTEARFQPVAAHPGEVVGTGVDVEERRLVSARALERFEREHQTLVKRLKLSRALDGHPDTSVPLAASRDAQRKRRLRLQPFANERERCVEVADAYKLLSQRDMRKMLVVQAKSLGLVNGQACAFVDRSLGDGGGWENG